MEWNRVLAWLAWQALARQSEASEGECEGRLLVVVSELQVRRVLNVAILRRGVPYLDMRCVVHRQRRQERLQRTRLRQACLHMAHAPSQYDNIKFVAPADQAWTTD